MMDSLQISVDSDKEWRDSSKGRLSIETSLELRVRLKTVSNGQNPLATIVIGLKAVSCTLRSARLL